MADKKIEVCEVAIKDLQDKIGNPRKIGRKQLNELKDSFDDFGDFGIIVIDEENNIISGHQRVQVLKDTQGGDAKVLCKRLVNYSLEEKMAINIKANTHAGTWDMTKLAEWTSQMVVKIGLDVPDVGVDDVKVRDMELIRYEKYDYVMIVCRSEIDYLNLIRMLKLEDKKVVVGHGKSGDRRIKARAVWYDYLTSVVELKEKKQDETV